jgi:hypothetical protein
MWMKAEGIGSGSCSVSDFGFSYIWTPVSVTRELVE